MRNRQAFQFGLKAVLATVTLTGMVLGIHTCPPPAGPLLMKAGGGIVLFAPILFAVYFADWFQRRF
jgi:hypothetical protein